MLTAHIQVVLAPSSGTKLRSLEHKYVHSAAGLKSLLSLSQKNFSSSSKKSKSPKNKVAKEINSKKRNSSSALSLVSSYIALYIHIFTNYVCFIHDDRRDGESCHRRKIGRFQEKRRRGAEQERAIGTRALICFYFFTRIFGTL